MKGYGDNKFGPNDNVTREQMAAVLYRYAEYKAYDITAKGDLTVFTDANKVASWAKDALTWAVGAELVNGKGNATLDPSGNATRAEVAKILMNFSKTIVK